MIGGAEIESDNDPSDGSILDEIGETISQIFVIGMKEDIESLPRCGRRHLNGSPADGALSSGMTLPHLETFLAKTVIGTRLADRQGDRLRKILLVTNHTLNRHRYLGFIRLGFVEYKKGSLKLSVFMKFEERAFAGIG
jgi:hypothetical protein